MVTTRRTDPSQNAGGQNQTQGQSRPPRQPRNNPQSNREDEGDNMEVEQPVDQGNQQPVTRQDLEKLTEQFNTTLQDTLRQLTEAVKNNQAGPSHRPPQDPGRQASRNNQRAQPHNVPPLYS